MTEIGAKAGGDEDKISLSVNEVICYVLCVFHWTESVAGTEDVCMTHRFDRLTQKYAN